MTADEFWSHLEYRVCREINGLRAADYRGWWCDGFIPEQLELRSDRALFVGRVWMANGPLQDEWRFELYLPPDVKSESEVDWSALLPAEDVTAWLSLDISRKFLKIDLSNAVRDPDSP